MEISGRWLEYKDWMRYKCPHMGIGCENENGWRIKESMNELGYRIMNGIWDGLSGATWFIEEKEFTLSCVYECK